MAYFSEQSVRSLSSALSFVCLEARNSAPPGAMWHDVLALVYPVIQEHVQLQTSAISHSDKLPDELLVEIFDCLPLWDRVRAATVCHKWRRASLSARGRLWFLLERAGSAPVTFRYNKVNADNVGLLSDILADHLPHIRALDITTTESIRKAGWGHYIAQRGVHLAALQGTAPILERLRIVDPEALLRTAPRIPILNSPVLGSVDLRGVNMSLTSCVGSSTIRSLVVVTPFSSQVFTLEHIRSLRALETLSIKITDPQTTGVPAAGNPFPSSLESLSLHLGVSTLGQLDIAAHLSPLRSWRVSFISYLSESAEFDTVFPLFRDVVPVSAAIYFNSLLLNLMVIDAADHQRIVQAVKCNLAWSQPLAQAQRLTLGGLAHLPTLVKDTVSSFSSLEELTLDVTSAPGVSSSRWFSWPRLSCPNLRAVHMRSTRGSPEIELDVLTNVLRHSLGLGLDRLATLVLDRVRISAPPGVDVGAALDGLAETVSILDSGDIWPECQLVWNKTWDELTR
ncbi:hypothetical protein AURDEDRAFT_128820 [Auricularia subglabra TFB-10046 SS5]|nr:hypothetical protein AURDEDRAFT_128820 [Auricularia subglabra TFB-10046 SS5]